MNMDNQILQQIMNVQTQMLQHLTNLQQQQATNSLTQTTNSIQGNVNPVQNASGSYGTPLPSSIASPVTPPSFNNGPAMSVNDPTNYNTYAAPYSVGGRYASAAGFDTRGFISGSIAEMNNFDPTRHSVESTDMYISQQARGVQEQAVGIAGGMLKGGVSIGSFLIPGLFPSLIAGAGASVVVGGAANAMTNGARDSLNYQNLIQQKGYKFINAFESTSDLGGIGLGLNDRQEMSRYMRELAPEKYLSSDEMGKIFSGAADNNLLQTVTDVKSFKKKFSEMVDAVKEITVTMNQSIDEATKFMGDLQARGISTKDMPYIAAQAKVMASSLGVSAGAGAQLLMNTSDSIVGGTSLSASKIMKSSSENIFYAQQLQDYAQNNDPSLYNLIRNNGGAGNVGASYEQASRNYARSDQGSSMLMGLFSSAVKYNSNTGKFEIDSNAMNGLLNGNQNLSQLQSSSTAALDRLTSGQKVELQGTIGNLFNDYADSGQISAFLKKNAELIMQQSAKSGNPIDMQTALVQMGYAPDYATAQLYAAQINQGTDPNLKKILIAKTLKEEQDSHSISNNPGLLKQGEFWFERNFVEPFGNAGQDVSDAIGRGMLNYQKFLTGVDNAGNMNISKLNDFSSKGLQDTINQYNNNVSGTKDAYNYLHNRKNELRKSGDIGASWEVAGSLADIRYGPQYNADAIKITKNDTNQGIDYGTFSHYMSEARNGTLDFASLANLENQKKYGLIDDMRKTMIQNQAAGAYDGFFGKAMYYGSSIGLGVTEGASWLWGHISPASIAKGVLNIGKGEIAKNNAQGTFKSLEDQEKELQNEKKRLHQDAAALFASRDLSGMDENDLVNLQEKIESGDIPGVKSLTNNKTALELAKRAGSLKKIDNEYSKNMGSFTQVSEYTSALANSSKQLGNLLSASGMSESDVNDLIGGVRSKGKDVIKGLKKKTLSVSGMASADEEMLRQYDSIFAEMPQYDLNQIASYLQSKDPTLDLKKLLKNGSSDTIDSKKLENYLLNDVVKTQDLKPESAGKKKSASSDDVKKAATDHTKAMYDFLTSFQQETQMLADAQAGRPIAYNSSLGTR